MTWTRIAALAALISTRADAQGGIERRSGTDFGGESPVSGSSDLRPNIVGQPVSRSTSAP